MATDYSDLLLSPQDRFLYQKFLRFSKPQPTGGGGGGGSVVPQPERPAEFDTSVLPTSPNYVNPRTGEIGPITDLTRPAVVTPTLKDYIVGRPDDPNTVLTNEKVNPIGSFILDRFNAKMGVTRKDLDEAERQRIAREYREDPISIQFLDNNEVVDLGSNRANLPRAIEETTNVQRPYRIIGLAGDFDGLNNYDDRVKRLQDSQDTQKILSDVRERQEGFNTILATGFTPGGPTASSDIGLIFAFMKILDPGSTVREGEFALTEDKTPLFEKAFGKNWRQIVTKEGEFLSPKTRKNHIKTAINTYYKQIDLFEPKLDFVRETALRRGVRPEDVLGPDQKEVLTNQLITDLKRAAVPGNGYSDSDILEIVDVLDVATDIKNSDLREILKNTGITMNKDNSNYNNTDEFLKEFFPDEDEEKLDE